MSASTFLPAFFWIDFNSQFTQNGTIIYLDGDHTYNVLIAIGGSDSITNAGGIIICKNWGNMKKYKGRWFLHPQNFDAEPQK